MAVLLWPVHLSSQGRIFEEVKVTQLVRSFMPLIEMKGLLKYFHRSSPQDSILSHLNPVHILILYLFKVRLNTIVCLNSDIKLHNFGAALADLNQVLEAQPLNIKALLRRGVAHQNKNNYEQVHIILSSYLGVAKLKWNGWLKNAKPVSD